MRLRSPNKAVSLMFLVILMAVAVFALGSRDSHRSPWSVEGEVNYQRSTDEKDKWYEGTTNLPLDVLDQIFTGGDGRAEIQLTASNVVRIDHERI